MSQNQLWSSGVQPHTIFHWEQILSIWNETYMPSHPINCVLVNWKYSKPRGLTAHQFKKYLNGNEEQDGMKWFLFECVMDRFSMTSLEFCSFIRCLTDDIELDTNFPAFPGSPTGTVREFLHTHLSATNEIGLLDLMPPLVSVNPAMCDECTCDEKFANIQILIMRDKKKASKENPDDRITIDKNKDDMYSMTYVDKMSNTFKASTLHNISAEDVLQRLSQIFRLMSLDSAPFEAIQLFVPNYPSVLINVDKLDSYTRDIIYDTVESTMKNWPVWT